MTTKKTTIVHVANAAGVSISTVSRVLNGKGVKKSTLIKVNEAIHELDFSPDPAARSMVSKETKTIGMLVPNLSNEFWGAISDAVQEELWNNGYSLIICSFNYEMERENALLKMLVERNVDGIIFGTSTPTLGSNDYSHIAALQEKYQLPCVSLDRK
jgi:DNA-binding LacI/PurR family transcriptional regulator